MAEIVKGTPEEKAEIVDFINYVFSQAHRPHDFKTLIPKSYADHVAGLGGLHYMVKEDGKIRALIADRIIDTAVGDFRLKVGLIGNVSVHPYARGEGYMRNLLSLAIREAKELGVDLMALGGQRQRYGYFGFENGGHCFSFHVSANNLRHAAKDVDASAITFRDLTEERPEEIDRASALYHADVVHAIRPREEFLDIVHNWNSPARAIYDGERMIGYMMGLFGETVLEDESDFPRVLCAAFRAFDLGAADIAVPVQKEARIAYLASICETYTIRYMEKIRVLCWQRVLSALLWFRSTYDPLEDGDVVFTVEGETLRISVRNNVPTVTAVTDPCAPVFTLLEAERIFFGLQNMVRPDPRFYNWLPLPFYLDPGDTY